MVCGLALVCLAASSGTHQGATVQAAPIAVAPLKVMEGLRALALAASPRSSVFAATMEDHSVCIINAANRQTLHKMEGHPQPAMALAWSHDGTMLASGDESARIFVWNAETGSKLHEMRDHQRGIQDLSFNYPRTLLVSTGKDDAVKLWDPGTGRELKTVLGQGQNFFSATFRGRSNDWGVGILGSGARMYTDDGKPIGFLVGHNGQGVFDIAFNPTGTRAVTAGRDGTAIVWDALKKEKLGTLKGHGDWVVHCAWSANGKWIATSGDDRTVRIWNPYTFQQVAKLDDQSAVGSPLCFTADGKYLLTVNFSDFLEVNTLVPPQPVEGSAEAGHHSGTARHHRSRA